MITANIWHRVFRICLGGDVGTGFAIEVDERQYIITAKHLLLSRKSISSFEVDHDGKFHTLSCKLVGFGKQNSDIVILSASQQLAPLLPAPTSKNGLVWSQDVYFLGFPYNMAIPLGELNSHFPFPLVKKAILS